MVNFKISFNNYVEIVVNEVQTKTCNFDGTV